MDIAERLRAAARHPYMDNTCKVRTYDALEAADEIEKLRDALKPFADIAKELDADSLRYCDIDITVAVADLRAARAAMGEGDDRL